MKRLESLMLIAPGGTPFVESVATRDAERREGMRAAGVRVGEDGESGDESGGEGDTAGGEKHSTLKPY